MNKTCLIIAGGEYSDPSDLTGRTFDLIIACDKGYEYAKERNIIPDIIIGDFDSYQGDFDGFKGQIIRLPVEKDDTDTGYAIKQAISENVTHITICCAMGGRFDHAFGNIQGAAMAADKNIPVTVLGANEIINVFKQTSITLKNKPGWSVSVFSLSDNSEGVTIKGAKYSVDNITLPNRGTLGLSNEWKDDYIEVSCTSGILMVIESRL